MRNRRLLLVAVVRFVVSPMHQAAKGVELARSGWLQSGPKLKPWPVGAHLWRNTAAGRGGLCIGPDLLRSRRAALGAHLLPGQGYHTTRPQR